MKSIENKNSFILEKKRLLLTSIYLVLSFVIPGKTQTNSKPSKPSTLCGEGTAKIMILGLYHMDNPGQDKYNIEADDVLSPKRQREIKEVLDAVAAYKPTKIAIESAYRSTFWTSRYEQYLRSEYQLGRNEIEQIGFQLAKRLNHSNLYPIDYPMWMNGTLASEREEQTKKPTLPPSPISQTTIKVPPTPLPAYLAKLESLIKSGTVLDVLRYVNSEEYIRPSQSYYMEMLMPGDSIFIYEQTDEVTNWYKRNLRMITNINRITEFPHDRVLIIVGAGHLKILKDFANDSPQFCFIDSGSYLKN